MADVIEREVVREPMASTNQSNNSNNSVLIAVLIIVLILVLLFIFGGFGRRFFGVSRGTNINVPEKVDVNINKTQ